jgi:hypothetical protein
MSHKVLWWTDRPVEGNTINIRPVLYDAWAQRPCDEVAYCVVCHNQVPYGEVYYHVTQFERGANGKEPPVCKDHIRGLVPEAVNLTQQPKEE